MYPQNYDDRPALARAIRETVAVAFADLRVHGRKIEKWIKIIEAGDVKPEQCCAVLTGLPANLRHGFAR